MEPRRSAGIPAAASRGPMTRERMAVILRAAQRAGGYAKQACGAHCCDTRDAKGGASCCSAGSRGGK